MQVLCHHGSAKMGFVDIDFFLHFFLLSSGLLWLYPSLGGTVCWRRRPCSGTQEELWQSRLHLITGWTDRIPALQENWSRSEESWELLWGKLSFKECLNSRVHSMVILLKQSTIDHASSIQKHSDICTCTAQHLRHKNIETEPILYIHFYKAIVFCTDLAHSEWFVLFLKSNTDKWVTSNTLKSRLTSAGFGGMHLRESSAFGEQQVESVIVYT